MAEKTRAEVYADALRRNGLTSEVAGFLAELESRVYELEQRERDRERGEPTDG